MKRSLIVAGTLLLIAGLTIGYQAGRARAYGVPTTSTLSYTGSLLTFGQPDNSMHSISAALWLPSATTAACASTAAMIQVTQGQFTVPLPPQCATVIHQNPNLQVEVTIDSTPLGLTSLSAVPYALEAGSVTGSQMLANIGLTATVASSALTINLVQDDGLSTPTATNPVIIGFRSLTAGSGALAPLQATGTTPPLVVPSGATLGQLSSAAEHTFVYAQDNAGSVQLCVCTSGDLDEGSLQTSLIIGSTATSRSTLYCTAAATGPVRLIGRLLSTQGTAGAWGNAPVEITTPPFTTPKGPTFSAYASTNGSSGAGAITELTYDTAELDTDNSFTASSHSFKPPLAGYYHIGQVTQITCPSGNGGFTLWSYIYKNGAIFKQNLQLISYASGFNQSITIDSIIYMNGTTDTLTGYFETNVGTCTAVGGEANTYLSGTYVHP